MLLRFFVFFGKCRVDVHFRLLLRGELMLEKSEQKLYTQKNVP